MNSIRRQGVGMTSLRTRERLVQRLIDQGISNISILDAIRVTPRHLFIEEALSNRAYEDVSLPIGFNQTISQPYIVARMTEIILSALGPLSNSPNIKVLEVGTGCGYQTAILAHIVKHVHSIERIRPLLEKTKARLRELEIRNVSLRCADGSYGWTQNAPFDAIITTAAAEQLPNGLLDQLAEGGVLVIPVGDSHKQELQVCRKINGQIQTSVIEPVMFVPLVSGVER